MNARSFWTPILTHPDIEPRVLMGMATVDEFLDWIDGEGVTEERHDGGGLVYVEKEDGVEVHVAFLPGRWGRYVACVLAKSFGEKMRQGQTLIAREQEGYYRSRPPRSHGWIAVEEFQKSPLPVRLRRWILTPDAWYRSPVGRKTS